MTENCRAFQKLIAREARRRFVVCPLADANQSPFVQSIPYEGFVRISEQSSGEKIPPIRRVGFWRRPTDRRGLPHCDRLCADDPLPAFRQRDRAENERVRFMAPIVFVNAASLAIIFASVDVIRCCLSVERLPRRPYRRLSGSFSPRGSAEAVRIGHPGTTPASRGGAAPGSSLYLGRRAFVSDPQDLSSNAVKLTDRGGIVSVSPRDGGQRICDSSLILVSAEFFAGMMGQTAKDRHRRDGLFCFPRFSDRRACGATRWEGLWRAGPGRSPEQ